MKRYQVFVLFFILSFVGINASAQLMSGSLLCEYHSNPIGIDVTQPRLSWQLISGDRNVEQSAYEIRVARTVSDLSEKDRLVWTSGKVVGSQSVNIVYAGPALKSMQGVYWQVRIWDNKQRVSEWSEAAYWEMGMLEEDSWKASWITMPNEKEANKSLPAHYYRNEFKLSKEVKSARAYVSSLGLYRLFLNGEKVGDELFTPGWTSYNKRLQYQSYDVTHLLQMNNAVGAVVGDGWYRGNIGWADQHNYYGEKLALLLQLNINYVDGSSETICSDEAWKVSNGPIQESDIYNGESYDARLEINDWNKVGCKEKNWVAVSILDHTKENLIAPLGLPVKAIEELDPIGLIITPKGEVVMDMGQNMVGWIKIRMKGSKGDTVGLKFAEVLDKEGNFYTENLRAARATDSYVFKDDEEVVYEPTFTFHGFRYVKLEGFDQVPALKDIKGIVVHSEMAPRGSFSCSDPLINQLQHNIRWGQKGNFLDVPTDCPQRDERMGWTGDAQVFSMTAAFNYDVAAFYTKWMKDLIADQLPNGSVPHVIPDVLKGNGGATGWADAIAIIPWSVYQVYGDTRILEENYRGMVRWVAYMEEKAGSDYLWMGDAHFGDWLAFASNNSSYPGATTEKDLIATAYYYYTTALLGKISGVLGKKSEADKYGALAGKVKQAFISEFVTPNGRLVSHTQTAYALALSFGLLPDNIAKKAAHYLALDVEKFGHLTTGFLGTPLLCKTLAEIGRDDLAFMLLNRKDYPSWLYPVTQGATTIWERWDGQKPDGTFQDVRMNSFNHYAYGAIGEWLYTYVAGIALDPQNPGYKKFYLSPHPGGGLTDVSASYTCMYGEIKSEWSLENDLFKYAIEIPANTTATIVLPNAILADIEMDAAKQNDNNVSIELGSGNYSFQYRMKN